MREATPDDLDWLIQELRAFSGFYTSKLSLFPADESGPRAKMLDLINGQFVRIAEIRNRAEPGAVTQGWLDGIRVGFIVGMLGTHFFNPEIRTFTEVFWWVTPEHRGTSAGARLFAEFVEFGKLVADWIVFGLEHNSPVKDETLLSRGFRHQERSFVLEVDPRPAPWGSPVKEVA